MDNSALIIGLIVILLIWVSFYFIPFGHWFTARLSGVQLSLIRLTLMRFRKSNIGAIINSLIVSSNAGLNFNIDELEAHDLAGGDILNVISALVSAKEAGIQMSFKQAAMADLNGENPMEVINILKEKKYEN